MLHHHISDIALLCAFEFNINHFVYVCCRHDSELPTPPLLAEFLRFLRSNSATPHAISKLRFFAISKLRILTPKSFLFFFVAFSYFRFCTGGSAETEVLRNIAVAGNRGNARDFSSGILFCSHFKQRFRFVLSRLCPRSAVICDVIEMASCRRQRTRETDESGLEHKFEIRTKKTGLQIRDTKKTGQIRETIESTLEEEEEEHYRHRRENIQTIGHA